METTTKTTVRAATFGTAPASNADMQRYEEPRPRVHAVPASNPELDGILAESLVLRGDVSGMNPAAKADYYLYLCTQLGLNPATQPIAFLKLNGKEVPYVLKGATDQLARRYALNREVVDGPKVVDLAGTKLVYCACKATLPSGRTEVSVATLPLTDPAMVLMKAETKAKRRVTLSILGLGMMDESEVEDIPSMHKHGTGGTDPASEFARRQSGDAEETDAAPVTALDLLRDDLESAETLDAVRACWADRQRAVTAMDEGEFTGALHTAREMVNARIMKLGLATSPTGADALMKAGDEPELLADFRLAIDVTGESDAPARAIVLAYVAWRERLEKLPKPWPAQAKRYAIQAYSAALAIDEKEGAKQLAAAIKKHDAPPPPDGSDPKAAKPRAVAPASDAQGSASESSGAPANTQARAPHLDNLMADSPRRVLPETEPFMVSADAWEANCMKHRATQALLNSWARHVPGLRAAGVARERLYTIVARYESVAAGEGRTFDEGGAYREFRNAERLADEKAAKGPAALPRVGRTATTVRRQLRDAAERPMAKVA